MISSRPVICQHCRERFVREEGNFEKGSKGYYHIECYRQINKNKSDSEALFEYLRELWGEAFINYPLLQKQIKEYTLRNNMTVQGILGTVIYITDVKKIRLNPQMGLGLIPYHYSNARIYFERQARIENSNTEKIENKEVVITINEHKTNRLERLIDIESLLSEEEY